RHTMALGGGLGLGCGLGRGGLSLGSGLCRGGLGLGIRLGRGGGLGLGVRLGGLGLLSGLLLLFSESSGSKVVLALLLLPGRFRCALSVRFRLRPIRAPKHSRVRCFGSPARGCSGSSVLSSGLFLLLSWFSLGSSSSLLSSLLSSLGSSSSLLSSSSS